MSKKSSKLKALDAALDAVLEAYIRLRDEGFDVPFNLVSTDHPFQATVESCVKAVTDDGHPVTVPLLASLCRSAYTDSKRKDKYALTLDRYDADTLIELARWFATRGKN